jgi:hypothetical protein
MSPSFVLHRSTCGQFQGAFLLVLQALLAGPFVFGCFCHGQDAFNFVDKLDLSMVDRFCLDGRIDSAFVDREKQTLHLLRGSTFLELKVETDDGDNRASANQTRPPLNLARKLGRPLNQKGQRLDDVCRELQQKRVTSVFDLDNVYYYVLNYDFDNLVIRRGNSCNNSRLSDQFVHNSTIPSKVTDESFTQVFVYRSMFLFFKRGSFAILNTRAWNNANEYQMYGPFPITLIDHLFPVEVSTIVLIGHRIWIITGTFAFRHFPTVVTLPYDFDSIQTKPRIK